MLEHCIYCGDWWQCRDHVIPINYEQIYRDYKPGSTVKCCNECNSFLGDKGYHTIQSRAGYLIKAYIRNRKKDLNLPEWEQSELGELGHNLRSSAESRLARKWLYEMKLENLERVSNGFECRPFRYRRNEETGAIITTSRKCFNCGNVFYNEKKNDFCSQYCNAQHKAKLVAEKFPAISEVEAQRRIDERECLLCGARLKTTNINAFFCSKECNKILNEVANSVVKI